MSELSDRVIYIGNIPAELDEASLLAVFSNCGPVVEIRRAGQGPASLDHDCADNISPCMAS